MVEFLLGHSSNPGLQDLKTCVLIVQGLVFHHHHIVKSIVAMDDRHLIEVGANVKNNPVFGKAKLLQQREEVGEGVRLVPHLGCHHHSRRGGDGEQKDEDANKEGDNSDDNDSPERR